MLQKLTFSIAFLLLPFSIYALDLNLDLDLSLTEQSALTELSDSDWIMLKAKARDVLKNKPDGENHIWRNGATGHSGVIMVLSTDAKNEQLCRNTQFINTANNITSTTIVNLCAQPDGTWSEESQRYTTTGVTSEMSGSPRQSDMFIDESNKSSTEITKKTLSQTSDFCRKLAQDMEALKGKPIRRNAAVEQHKAECRR